MPRCLRRTGFHSGHRCIKMAALLCDTMMTCLMVEITETVTVVKLLHSATCRVELVAEWRRGTFREMGNKLHLPDSACYSGSLKACVYNRTACDSTDCQSEDEPKEEPVAERRRSSLSELGNKLTSLILPLKTLVQPKYPPLAYCSATFCQQSQEAGCIPFVQPTSTNPGMAQSLSHSLTSSRAAAAAAVARGGRGLWLWLAMVVVLAGLLALLASLVMQPAVDAAPVGTGDSWMTIQQLLWPYAGLRYNGQPPV
ncbi:hypothetical protein INR49_031528 [Caranx melampygus]|nr:hypothetical protein INR49_031528 [Caranx melampygus]